MKTMAKIKQQVELLKYVVLSIKRYDNKIILCSFFIILTGVILPYSEILLPKFAIQLLLEGTDTIAMIVKVCLFMLIVMVLHFLYEFCISQRSWRLSFIQQGSSHDLLHKNLTCRYNYSEAAEVQALYNRLRQITDSSENNCYMLVLFGLTNIALGVLGAVLYSFILGSVHIIIVLLLLLSSIFHYLIMRKISLYEHKFKKTWEAVDKKIGYLLSVTGDAKFTKDIKLYGMNQWLSNKIRKLFQARKKYDESKQNTVFGGGILSALNSVIREGVAYLILVYMVVNKYITLDNFVLYMGAVRGLSNFILKVLNGVVSVKSASIYIEDIQKYISDGKIEEGNADLPVSILHAPITVEFKNINFTYPEGKQIFKDFNLEIPGGSKVALVGLNGAGKTTLINLLCGLYTPDTGQILLNGYDINRFLKQELFQIFGTVFQDNFIIPLTLRENIAPVNSQDEEGIEKCVSLSGLEDILKESGKDIHTPMSKIIYEDGIVFSGGQSQKLYLARMLYKDAKLILLDEPTAALDPIAESKIYENYNELVKNKTTIFISHRLASTKFCHKILLLENGKIMESGTHDELMEHKGIYYDMFTVQSKYYV